LGWAQGTVELSTSDLSDLPKSSHPLARNRFLAATLLSLLAFAGTGVWLALTLKLKTESGTILLENLRDDDEVVVDGKTVTVRRGRDAKPFVEVEVNKNHELVVRSRGIVVRGEVINVGTGRTENLVVRKAPEAEAAKPKPDHVRPDEGFVPFFADGVIHGVLKVFSSADARNWRIEDGVLIADSPGDRLFLIDRPLSDFELKAEVQLEDESSTGHFVFRTRGGREDRRHSGYSVCLGGRGRAIAGVLHRFVFMSWLTQPLENKNADYRLIPPGQWVTLRIKAIGNHFTSQIDDGPVLEADDPESRYDEGFIGCECRGTVRIRRILVKPLDEKPAPG
jgi:hypothetical protein